MSAAYKRTTVIIKDLLKIAQDEVQQHELQGPDCCRDAKDRKIWNLGIIVLRLHELHIKEADAFVSSFYSAHDIEAKYLKAQWVDTRIACDGYRQQEETNRLVSLSCPKLMERTLTLLNMKRQMIKNANASKHLAPTEGAIISASQNALSSQSPFSSRTTSGPDLQKSLSEISRIVFQWTAEYTRRFNARLIKLTGRKSIQRSRLNNGCPSTASGAVEHDCTGV